MSLNKSYLFTLKLVIAIFVFGVIFFNQNTYAQLPATPTARLQKFKFPGPSIVKVQGTQLIVQKRKKNGKLATAQPFKMRGVAYSPVDFDETINNNQDARTHLVDSLYPSDFPSIKMMNANTIRTFVDMGIDNKAQQFLDHAYANDIWVLVTLSPDIYHEAIDPSNAQIIKAYRNHPALLGWVIGNEWNLNYFYENNITIAQITSAVEQTAQLIKSLDTKHPVASSLGFLSDHYNMAQSILSSNLPFVSIVAGTPSIDFWGLNVYRSKNLDPLFVELDTLMPGKPFFLAEFGTDSLYGYPGIQDEVTQSDTYVAIWDQLHRNLSAIDPSNTCIGGIAFSWNDEWWKKGFKTVQDYTGFTLLKNFFNYIPTQTIELAFIGHPDAFSNEEHYGVVKLDRTPKLAYYGLQSAYSLSQIKNDPIPLAAKSQGGPGGNAQALYWMKKNNLAFSLRHGACCTGHGRGFNIAVIDRASGRVSDIKNFDVYQNTSECQNLKNYIQTVKPGDIIMAAVADTAFGNQNFCAQLSSMSQMNDCRAAFQLLGSQQIANLKMWQPWSFIAIAGVLGTPLAEAIGVGSCTPTVDYSTAECSANIVLDADRDGILDTNDLDNDNDGVTDVQEAINGTDALDPAA